MTFIAFSLNVSGSKLEKSKIKGFKIGIGENIHKEP